MAVIYPFDEPWETMYSGQQAEALNRDFYSSNAYLRTLKPPLPQIQYLPNRFGYTSYADRQPDVYQVFGINRLQPAMLPDTRQAGRNTGFASQQSQYDSSDRNSGYDALGSGGWGGSGA